MIANPNDGNSPQVEVATPTISVSAGGLITATTQQGKGYVPGGSKSATQQLPTQGAKTVTPTTTEQIAVASGRYTTGDVKVAGDANLVAENIAEGVSIFGVTGTLSGGSGAMATGTLNVSHLGSSINLTYTTPGSPGWITKKISSASGTRLQIAIGTFIVLEFSGSGTISESGGIQLFYDIDGSTLIYVVNDHFTVRY